MNSLHLLAYGTMTQLAGKVCLVTGATRGLGKGIALQLADTGATVYITGKLIIVHQP